MSDSDAKADNTEQSAETASAEDAPQAVKRGGLAVGLVIILSLIWYLASDRYTPYTTQARVQGYVLGVPRKARFHIATCLSETMPAPLPRGCCPQQRHR